MVPFRFRPIPAALVVLLCLPTGFVAAGFSTTAPAPDEWFRIAQPHGGDAWTTTSWSITNATPTLTAVTDSAWGLAEAWQSPAGEWHAVHRSTTSVKQATGDGRFVRADERHILWVDQANDAVLASSTARGQQDPNAPLGPLERIDFAPHEHLCALDALLVRGVSANHTVHASCDGVRWSFTSLGWQRLGDVHVMAWQAQRDGQVYTRWYAPGTPVALRTRLQTATNDTVTDVISFRPGNEAWGHDVALPASAPPVALLPRLPWGPDDSGIDHPFPLSAAWERALQESPRFAAFMAGDPEAAAWRASLTQFVSPDGVERTWLVGLQAHGQTAAATWSRIDTTSADGKVLVTYNDSFETTPEEQPVELPAQLPALWAVREMWKRIDPRAADFETWNWQAYGPGADGVVVGFGMQHFEGTPAQLAQGPGSNVTLDASGILVNGAGEPFWFAAAFESDPPGAQYTSEGEIANPVLAPMLAFAGPRWAIPGIEVQAAIGFLSLLAGLIAGCSGWARQTFVALFSREQGPAVLRHPVRQRLAQLVNTRPGIHFQELRRLSGLGNHALRHHLDKLQRGGVIETRHDGRRLCHFPAGGAAHYDPARAAALRSRLCQNVLAQAVGTPGASGQDLARALGLHRSTVSVALARLRAGGLVETRRVGRRKTIWPTPAARAVSLNVAAFPPAVQEPGVEAASDPGPTPPIRADS